MKRTIVITFPDDLTKDQINEVQWLNLLAYIRDRIKPKMLVSWKHED